MKYRQRRGGRSFIRNLPADAELFLGEDANGVEVYEGDEVQVVCYIDEETGERVKVTGGKPYKCTLLDALAINVDEVVKCTS